MTTDEAINAIAPIADEQLPEPYFDNARERRILWACAVGRCCARLKELESYTCPRGVSNCRCGAEYCRTWPGSRAARAL